LGPGLGRAMKIFVNGEAINCDDGTTVEQLIERHELSAETTLVERNGIALHRREWEAEYLQENDRVEILRVAAGG
jgi:thiamine biosynthesis protein ThiS